MKSYKGIIFDLDGVICTTDSYHYKAWKKIADRLNIPFSEADNSRLRGVSRRESLEIILERYSGQPLTDSEKSNYVMLKMTFIVRVCSNFPQLISMKQSLKH